jgi:hypothetical protein
MDGKIRILIVRFLGGMADYEEQALLTGVMSGRQCIVSERRSPATMAYEEIAKQ